MVLDDLVFEHAALRLLDRHLGERDALLVGGHGGLEEDLVHLLLRVGGEDLLGLAHLHELRLEGVDGVDDLRGRGCLFHHVSLLAYGDLSYSLDFSKIFLGER